MKFKEIFKKWHFWLVGLGYPIYLLWVDITSVEYYALYGLDLNYPFLISYFIIRFLIVVIIYSVLWFFLWKNKKDEKQ